MLSTRTKETMLAALKSYPDHAFYGWSVFGGCWYAARTEAELTRIGVLECLRAPKPSPVVRRASACPVGPEGVTEFGP